MSTKPKSEESRNSSNSQEGKKKFKQEPRNSVKIRNKEQRIGMERKQKIRKMEK